MTPAERAQAIAREVKRLFVDAPPGLRSATALEEVETLARLAIDAAVTDALHPELRPCKTCGHAEEMHEGGMLGSWCDGVGTWNTWPAMKHPDRLCQCKGFVR